MAGLIVWLSSGRRGCFHGIQLAKLTRVAVTASLDVKRAPQTQNTPRTTPEQAQNDPQNSPRMTLERPQNTPRTSPEQPWNSSRTAPEQPQNNPRTTLEQPQNFVTSGAQKQVPKSMPKTEPGLLPTLCNCVSTYLKIEQHATSSMRS